jgi:hypothetical protein
MRQLVGLSCVLCRERIGRDLDGRFCESCGCPVHTHCVRPAEGTGGEPRCATCGAATDRAQQEQSLHRQYKDRRTDAIGGRNPLIFVAGIVGFSIMSVSALNSTLHPRPDGRLLNTAPAIGVDLFLPVGLIGIGFCLFRLARGR